MSAEDEEEGDEEEGVADNQLWPWQQHPPNYS
jgi:hypothetical protein